MFTSRAEHRLLLREDNADLRLTPRGREFGLVDDERWTLFEHKVAGVAAETRRLEGSRVHPGQVSGWSQRVLGAPLARDATLLELLRRPEVDYAHLDELSRELALEASTDFAAIDDRLPREIRLQLEVLAKYSGYIERQQDEIERQRRHEDTRLPANLDYAAIPGLSNEVRQKLTDARPGTVGQAARVPGVTPAAVSILLIWLKKRSSRAA
jgi:tRNA uridine 5-carboxymethylaminomethyl modification enzyme